MRPRLAVLTHFGLTMLRARPWELAETLSRETGIRSLAASDRWRLDLDAELGADGQAEPDGRAAAIARSRLRAAPGYAGSASEHLQLDEGLSRDRRWSPLGALQPGVAQGCGGARWSQATTPTPASSAVRSWPRSTR